MLYAARKFRGRAFAVNYRRVCVRENIWTKPLMATCEPEKHPSIRGLVQYKMFSPHVLT